MSTLSDTQLPLAPHPLVTMSAPKVRRYVIAGGGTSGHINPALAIADQLMRDNPAVEIQFCGTARGLESQLVPRAGYAFTAIRARGLPHRVNRELFRAIADFFAGRAQCRNLLKTFCPDAVIGTGGYVCSPLVAAASSLKIPVLLHEQNAFPGRSNRLLAHRSQVVCISMPGAEKHFKTKAPIILTGNPVREIFFKLTRKIARQQLNWNDKTIHILVTGGSLGAKRLNDAVLGLAADAAFAALQQSISLQIHVACGQRHIETVQAVARNLEWLDVHEYLHDLPTYMAASDLIVARAGAMTCAELAALGKPSLLVPYPFAAGDHQTENAKVSEHAGAAIRIADQDMTPTRLSTELAQLLMDPARLEKMGQQAKTLAFPDAASQICRHLYATQTP
ncbi:MAG: undecaprenyldiphospho-muramoylpentapeptide beta-N-acetylglucosaminyltransferase [Eubacteriales bacterium]|nr:undecaprenyldiphospho-muramoylpentapeptide beta-N-acetylglucosaminyltransferase [Eubacteriales bacterium]